MIETSLYAWIGFFGLIGLASMAGIALARLMPWKPAGAEAGFVLATGIVLSPLLAGIASVLALLLLPGSYSSWHLVFVGLFLVSLSLLNFTRQNNPPRVKQASDWITRLLQGLLILWFLALFCNSVFLPLTQNDPLEYATVGRLIYQSKSLAIYPVLDTVNNASGFFGPWTHPPLYVSMIYLVSAIQGHASAPGLMHLIAPWFLLCSTVGVVALARLQTSSFKLIAGILFVSTPMLFLGADSAQIDPLPTSAVVLLMLMLVGLQQQKLTGCWLGLALGLGLWTHSQAVLFIPILGVALLFLRGLKGWRQALLEFATACGVALLIAAYPYWNNFLIFGSPISDNPAVFALPKLDWSGYFRYARGLNTGPAVIQYGVLKGWFSFEAYALNFWLMTIGVVFLIARTGMKKILTGVKNGFAEFTPDMTMLWLSLGIILTYLGGVVVSVLAGIDLMIRNERYLLVIMPAVVLIASYGVSELAMKGGVILSNWQHARQQSRTRFVLVALAGAFFALAQLATVGWYYHWRSVSAAQRSSTIAQVQPRLQRILNNISAFEMIGHVASKVPEQSLILSMRPADMYYADRKMVSYLDPAMLPVYLENSIDGTLARLKGLGVQYVHSVDYTLPPMSNSFIQNILASPQLSTLEYSAGMFQLYSLKDSGLREGPAVNITPGVLPWTKTTTVHFLGNRLLNHLGMVPELVTDNSPSVSDFSLFNRDYSVLTQLGIDSSNFTKQSASYIKVDSNSEYVLKITIKGQGFVRIWMTQFNTCGYVLFASGGKTDNSLRMGELSLSERYPEQVFLRRFKPQHAARYVRIGVEQLGQSQMQIVQATLVKLI